jgi:hypothetical protein
LLNLCSEYSCFHRNVFNFSSCFHRNVSFRNTEKDQVLPYPSELLSFWALCRLRHDQIDAMDCSSWLIAECCRRTILLKFNVLWGK